MSHETAMSFNKPPIEVTVCTFTKLHGSLWAHNIWVRVIRSLMSKVSTDLQHTGKVYTFINAMDLFGPTTYVKRSVSSLTPWICLGPQEQERFVDLTTPWVSTDPRCTGTVCLLFKTLQIPSDPRHTGKVCSSINTVGLFGLMTYRKGLFIHHRHESQDMQDMQGTKFLVTYRKVNDFFVCFLL